MGIVYFICVCCVPDVSALELVKSVKPDGNLMKNLMKQRPAMMSHLLQENMPKGT